MDNIPLNFGLFVLSKIRHLMNKDSPMLMFLSLIMELYKRAKVEESLGNNWISLKMPICPLKICGEGALSKGKKGKVYLGKLVDGDIDSCRPSTDRPFEESSKMQVVWELMSGFPTGLG